MFMISKVKNCLKLYLEYLLMGNKAQPKSITEEAIKTATQDIMSDRTMDFKPSIFDPISVLMRSFINGSVYGWEEGNRLHFNETFLYIVFDPLFIRQMLKMIKLLTERLLQWEKKSIKSIRRGEFETVYLIANFVLLFSNERILELTDSLLFRMDLSSETQNFIHQLHNLQDPPEAIGSIIDKVSHDEKQILEKALRNILVSIIRNKENSFSRSDKTQKSIAEVEETLFMLYMKLCFTKKKEDRKSAIQNYFEENLKIGAYFLAAGTSRIVPSVYESSVMLLYTLFKDNSEEIKKIKALPTHLFRNLPVNIGKSIYDYIICNALFTMKYVHEHKKSYMRFVFNRIMTLKMINEILKMYSTTNYLLIYYLEEICLQLKAGQIERTYAYLILKTYKEKNQIKSQVLSKFIQNNTPEYNLRYENRQMKVSFNEILNELDDTEKSLMKEYLSYSEKFIFSSVIHKNILYHYDDMEIWTHIVPAIIMKSSKREERICKTQGGEQRKPVWEDKYKQLLRISQYNQSMVHVDAPEEQQMSELEEKESELQVHSNN